MRLAGRESPKTQSPPFFWLFRGVLSRQLGRSEGILKDRSGVENMFESLDERIELDEQKEYSAKQRRLHYLAITAISVVVVGGIAIVFQYVK